MSDDNLQRKIAEARAARQQIEQLDAVRATAGTLESLEAEQARQARLAEARREFEVLRADATAKIPALRARGQNIAERYARTVETLEALQPELSAYRAEYLTWRDSFAALGAEVDNLAGEPLKQSGDLVFADIVGEDFSRAVMARANGLRERVRQILNFHNVG